MKDKYCSCGKELISDEDQRLGVCGDCKWNVSSANMNGNQELRIQRHVLNAREGLIIILNLEKKIGV